MEHFNKLLAENERLPKKKRRAEQQIYEMICKEVVQAAPPVCMVKLLINAEKQATLRCVCGRRYRA
jgi:hypothetical protein